MEELLRRCNEDLVYKYRSSSSSASVTDGGSEEEEEDVVEDVVEDDDGPVLPHPSEEEDVEDDPPAPHQNLAIPKPKSKPKPKPKQQAMDAMLKFSHDIAVDLWKRGAEETKFLPDREHEALLNALKKLNIKDVLRTLQYRKQRNQEDVFVWWCKGGYNKLPDTIDLNKDLMPQIVACPLLFNHLYVTYVHTPTLQTEEKKREAVNKAKRTKFLNKMEKLTRQANEEATGEANGEENEEAKEANEEEKEEANEEATEDVTEKARRLAAHSAFRTPYARIVAMRLYEYLWSTCDGQVQTADLLQGAKAIFTHPNLNPNPEKGGKRRIRPPIQPPFYGLPESDRNPFIRNFFHAFFDIQAPELMRRVIVWLPEEEGQPLQHYFGVVVDVEFSTQTSEPSHLVVDLDDGDNIRILTSSEFEEWEFVDESEIGVDVPVPLVDASGGAGGSWIEGRWHPSPAKPK